LEELRFAKEVLESEKQLLVNNRSMKSDSLALFKDALSYYRERYNDINTKLMVAKKDESKTQKRLAKLQERFNSYNQDIAKKYAPDIIHSHDWLTFPGGVAAKKVTGKPLITHVHSTEIDRTGGHYPNPYVYKIEKRGLDDSERVVSVSNFTKNILVNDYAINPDKIKIVHNGCEQMTKKELPPSLTVFKSMGYKIVLYLGRITLQKGPEYFVRAAKKVSEFNPKTIFIVAGSGDMQEGMIAEASYLGIIDKMVFTGFLRGDEKEKIYQAADLYVMPSVSEPFGITPLEAAANGTPVLVSKQSGVSEVLNNVLKTDFWDIDDMADKILAVLKYSSLSLDLKKESAKELPKINWDTSADKCIEIYNQLVRLRNEIANGFSQIDVQLKRRYDLIPNLVETAKGYMKHEQETLEKVIKARNQAYAINQEISDKPNQNQIKEMAQSEGQLTGALSKLMMLTESYPDLKANENMKTLMEELTSTENRISFARQHYNDVITNYNNSREIFPNSLISNYFSFRPEFQWEIENKSERENVKVSFS